MKYIVKFINIKDISSKMKQVRFKKPVDFKFKCGQFINVFINNLNIRSYSISSHYNDEYIDLTIRFPQNSKAFEFFNKLVVDDEVTIMGPFGRYVYNDNSLQKVHIVTGAGIGPNFSMLKEWAKLGAKQKSYIFFGIREFENIPYIEELKELEKLGLNIYFCISNKKNNLQQIIEPIKAKQNKNIFNGRVLDVIKNLNFNLEQKEFYICGQPEMVVSVCEFLKQNGVVENLIKYEKFNAGK